MLLKNLILGLLMAALSQTAFTCTIDGEEGFLPENKMWLSPDAKGINTINEDTFNEVIDKVVKIYRPVIESKGANLVVERKWADGTVNAYAQQQGSTWKISMFGGLARHNTITADGFALVVCHELGHHIGGAPKKKTWFSTTWASNEGQSDYFATAKCLRKAFRIDTTEEMIAALNVPQVAIDQCAEQFSDRMDQLICQRGAMAGMSTARLFQELRKQPEAPKFDTPDSAEVSKTDHNHPGTQCRLDTYYAGALCQIDDTIDVSDSDEAKGVCYRESGDTVGTRPRCWFKPSGSTSGGGGWPWSPTAAI